MRIRMPEGPRPERYFPAEKYQSGFGAEAERSCLAALGIVDGYLPDTISASVDVDPRTGQSTWKLYHRGSRQYLGAVWELGQHLVAFIPAETQILDLDEAPATEADQARHANAQVVVAVVAAALHEAQLRGSRGRPGGHRGAVVWSLFNS